MNTKLLRAIIASPLRSDILVGGIVVLLSSCGATKEVRYVYVDSPLQIQEVSRNYTSNNNTYVESTPQQQSVISPSTSSYNRNTPLKEAKSSKEVMLTSDVKTPNGFRGFGAAKTTSLSTTRSIALARAKSDLLKKVKDYCETKVKQKMDVTDSRVLDDIEERIDTKVKGVVGNIDVIQFYLSEGNVFDYAVCIEVSKNGVEEMINDIIREMRTQDNNK